ncbi:Retrovirus-related Pol polyprotein from transposon opus [Nosema granulosis]|uniref:Retrovirus-related Pol polyprotein from transposon opus n=1 Tax=Nosema granulosis TaxID=83296 RepID=A0A9P6KXV5_9MICR|nr:Retrovirus-related Pol polyprotein from transposon opus [Nosema granulosis]
MEGCKYIILGADVIKNRPNILMEIVNSLLPRERKQVLRITEEAIKEEFEDIFKTEIGELNLCTTGKHRIITTSETPICQRNGRIPISQEGIVADEIEKNLRLGIIRESRSPWCSRIVLASKADGSWRMCIGYRSLNQITIRDSYMSPRVDEIYDELSKARIFSILDATSGYYQIAMEESDKEKTAFSFKGRLYEYNRMPFGLCNAPETFQRAMDAIFRTENRKFVIPYLDDIIVYSQRIEDHEKHLKVVLGKLKGAGVSLNKKNASF